MCSSPSRRARATFFCIDRPSVATDRPPAMAASATCWTRWMWLAKQVTTKRRSGRARNTLRRVSPTVDSDGGEPGLLGVGRVGQQQPDPRVGGQRAHPGQVGPAAVHRVEVDLEVAGMEDDPLRGVEGGGEGVGDRVGDRDELDVARSDPPSLAVPTGMNWARSAMPASSTRLRARARVSSEP